MLKELLDRDERLIGWGSVQPAGTPWMKFSQAMLTMVPVVGVAIAAASSSSQARKRRVAVLTSKRLLMFRTDARPLDARALAFDEPLALLEFEALDAGTGQEPTFLVHFGGVQPAGIELIGGSAASVDRLREGLLSLCGHTEPL